MLKISIPPSNPVQHYRPELIHAVPWWQLPTQTDNASIRVLLLESGADFLTMLKQMIVLVSKYDSMIIKASENGRNELIFASDIITLNVTKRTHILG